MEQEKYISSRDVAEYLGICQQTIRKMEGRGLPFYKPGRKKMYKKSEVDEWLSGQRK